MSQSDHAGTHVSDRHVETSLQNWSMLRQQKKADRLKQLQDLERRVAKAASMNRQRFEAVTRSSHPRTSPSEQGGTPNNDYKTVDFHHASLEDLTGMTAAMAERLANFKVNLSKSTSSSIHMGLTRGQDSDTDRSDSTDTLYPTKTSVDSHDNDTHHTSLPRPTKSSTKSSTKSTVSTTTTTTIKPIIKSTTKSTLTMSAKTSGGRRDTNDTTIRPTLTKREQPTLSASKSHHELRPRAVIPRTGSLPRRGPRVDQQHLTRLGVPHKIPTIAVATPAATSLTVATTAGVDRPKIPTNKVIPVRPPVEVVRPPGARKRGKTLPGNLAPPDVSPLVLPPMKVEQLSVTLPTARRDQDRAKPATCRRDDEKPKPFRTGTSPPSSQVRRSGGSKTSATTTAAAAVSAATGVRLAPMSRSHTTRSKSQVDGEARARTRKVSAPRVLGKVYRHGLDDVKSGGTSMALQSERRVERATKPNETPRPKEIILRGGQPNMTMKDTCGHTFSIRVALTPQAALKLFETHLSSYERQEIMQYKQVYFVGHHAAKRPATAEVTHNNHSYDDDRGDYQVVLKDHLDYRYEVVDVLGRGSFGQVLRCFDHKHSETVAVKLIRNKKRFHAQALVEVRILENLLEWDPKDTAHYVRIRSHFVFRNHLCIVFECLGLNLYEVLKRDQFHGLLLTQARHVCTQLLQSLVVLHRHKLIHCDLKPENILLQPRSATTASLSANIKVIDFGSSCFVHERVYMYIQSRFYRAPEVILGMNYSTAIDMWSLGCIAAELYTGRPLFPGTNEQEQLACIMEVCGKPHSYLVDKSPRRNLFFESSGEPRTSSKTKRRREPGAIPLEEALHRPSATFVDFVRRCLDWDPEQRITAEEAMRHPWIVS